jgi:hypothetical protein
MGTALGYALYLLDGKEDWCQLTKTVHAWATFEWHISTFEGLGLGLVLVLVLAWSWSWLGLGLGLGLGFPQFSGYFYVFNDGLHGDLPGNGQFWGTFSHLDCCANFSLESVVVVVPACTSSRQTISVGLVAGKGFHTNINCFLL